MANRVRIIDNHTEGNDLRTTWLLDNGESETVLGGIVVESSDPAWVAPTEAEHEAQVRAAVPHEDPEPIAEPAVEPITTPDAEAHE